jgi:predicted nucleic acid-binding protein
MSLILDPSLNAEIYVLDSWPFMERELRGAAIPRLEELMGSAALGHLRLLISEMNLGEIFYLLAKRRGERDAEAWIEVAKRLPIEVIPVTSEQIWAAARLKAKTTLSYADCFVAVIAQMHDGIVVPGDPDFLQLRESSGLRVEWVGA